MTWGVSRRTAGFRLIILAACFAAWPAVASADHIRLVGGSDYPSVTVTDVAEGQVVFQTDAGRELRKPLAEIDFVSLDGLVSLAEIERLAAAGDYRQAAAGYERLLGEAGTTWRRRLILSRLLKAYDLEGRFDKAVETYVELVQDMGPAVRELAPANFPAPGSRFYELALGCIERAAVANHVKDEARVCLREFVEVVRRAQAGAGMQQPTPEETPDESPAPEPDSAADDATLLSQARRRSRPANTRRPAGYATRPWSGPVTACGPNCCTSKARPTWVGPIPQPTGSPPA